MIFNTFFNFKKTIDETYSKGREEEYTLVLILELLGKSGTMKHAYYKSCWIIIGISKRRKGPEFLSIHPRFLLSPVSVFTFINQNPLF